MFSSSSSASDDRRGASGERLGLGRGCKGWSGRGFARSWNNEEGMGLLAGSVCGERNSCFSRCSEMRLCYCIGVLGVILR